MKKSYFFKFFVFALVGALAILPSCQDYDDDISRLDKELGDAKTELTGSIASQLAALKTELNTSVDNKVKTVADDLAASKSQLAALEANSATKAQLDAVKAEILEQVVTLEVLEDLQADYDSEIAAILARIATLEEDGATKEDLAALETEITGMLSELQDELDAIDVRVTALDTSLTAFMAKHDEDLQDVIASIATLKAELDPRISTIETLLEIVDGESGVLNGIADDLADQLTKIGANADAIALLRSDLEAELADQLVLINANKTAIEAVETDLAAKYAELVEADADLLVEVKANYDELDGKITLNKDAIDALSLRVDAIEEEIEDIKDSITALEEDLNIKIGSLFTLAKNRLTSITLAPNAYLEGIEAVKFTSLNYSPMEAEENAQVDDTYTMSIGAPAVASYKFNPRTFVLGNADYNYVDRTAEIIMTTRAAGTSNLVEILSAPVYKPADGTVNFTLRRLNAHSTQLTDNDNKENFIALEATLKGAALAEGETGVVVAAPQELVYDELITPFDSFISDKATLTAGDDAHYPVTFDEAAASTKIWYEIPYDKVYDLLAKVATCDVTDDGHKAFDINAYNLKYKFSVATSEYNITQGSTTTNQQDWVELVSSTDGTYKAKEFNNELIGRTPILKVELVDQAGNVVRRAFVKVKFVAEKTPDITVGESHTLVYNCNNTAAQFEITEQYIRDNVYRVITSGKQTSMSHETFWATYEFNSSEVRKNNAVVAFSQPIIVDGDGGVSTATKKITWDFTHSEIGTVGAGAQLVASVTVKNKYASSEFPEYVTFKFTVNVTLPNVNLPAANKVENDQYWSKNADGSYYAYKVNVAVPAATDSGAADAIFKTSLPQAYSKYIVNTAGACTTNSYKVVATYSNGVKTTNPLAGVQISDTDITLDKTNDAVKTALNSAGGLQASVAHIYKLENGEEITVNTFLVDFIRPVNLNMPSGITVKDAKTGGDVADFQWNGILTDWRGEFIVDGSWVDVDTDESFWAYTYQPQYSWKDGYYELNNPASLNVVMGEVSFTIGSAPIELFKGTATYQVQKREWVWTSPFSGYWGSWTNSGAESNLVSEQMLTEDQVNTWLDFKHTELVAGLPNNTGSTLYRLVEVTAPNVTSEMVSTPGQVVEYSYVQSVTYVPADYTWVPGELVVVDHTPTDKPTVAGTHNGQVIGDWTWTVVITSEQAWAPGQYWDFYGPFTAIKADVDNATTNLGYNENKLPADATLEQVDNTVKYVNVGAPVGYSYEIYIPVTVTYGWGTLETVLTIVVVPAV